MGVANGPSKPWISRFSLNFMGLAVLIFFFFALSEFLRASKQVSKGLEVTRICLFALVNDVVSELLSVVKW